LIAGIVLLTVGALSTGIMNNIWTNKFKPRNGNLGVDRKELNCWKTLEEIGKRREIKKILKTYRKKLIPYSVGENFKKFGYKVLTSLPLYEQKGSELLHKLNTEKCRARNYTPTATLTRQRVDLLEAMVQVIVPNFQFNKDDSNSTKVFRALKELEIEGAVLERFIKDYILQSKDDHDTSVKDLKEYQEKLLASGLFKEAHKEHNRHNHHGHKHCDDGHYNYEHKHNDKHHHDHKKINIEFDLETLEKKPNALKAFMNSLEQYLLFEHIEKLRYEQYGLNDYFWELDKCKSQWERAGVSHQLNVENLVGDHHNKGNIHHKHNVKNHEHKETHHHHKNDHHSHKCGVC
jgi:hypothetical protein